MKLTPELEAITEATRTEVASIPEPLEPLHYVPPPKPEWVVDRHWKELTIGPYTRRAGWIKHGSYATKGQALQAATDLAKTESTIVDKHRIRNTKTGEVIEL